MPRPGVTVRGAVERPPRGSAVGRPTHADGAAVDASFTALADAKRREVIAALLAQPMRAGDLAREVALSPPALSRHLRILRRAGLVAEDSAEADARVRIYRVREDGFVPVRDWIADVEAFWSEQLAAFKAHAERKARDTPTRERADAHHAQAVHASRKRR